MLKQLRTKVIGDNFENVAKNYLKKQGLKFICSNFHSRFGEIDLIFKEGTTLVFIEVRYRKNTNFGLSVETINQKKQDKIIKTAAYYLHQNKLTEKVSCRFDVIGMEPNSTNNSNSSKPFSINWIKNAFVSI